MRISIRVPEPCNEDWNNMHPQGQARFCQSCKHSVMDLTSATDAELVELFTGRTPPKCARFDQRQLERALDAAQINRSRQLPIAAFTSLLAVASGQEVLAQTIGTSEIPATGSSSIEQKANAPFVLGDHIVVGEPSIAPGPTPYPPI